MLAADDSNADPLPNLMFEYKLGPRHLYASGDAATLFTNNETNNERLYGSANVTPYVKDAFHRHVVNGEACVNPDGHGTKAAFHFTASVPARASASVKKRPSRRRKPSASAYPGVIQYTSARPCVGLPPVIDAGSVNGAIAVRAISGIIAPAPTAETPGIARNRASALSMN